MKTETSNDPEAVVQRQLDAFMRATLTRSLRRTPGMRKILSIHRSCWPAGRRHFRERFSTVTSKSLDLGGQVFTGTHPGSWSRYPEVVPTPHCRSPEYVGFQPITRGQFPRTVDAASGKVPALAQKRRVAGRDEL